VLPVNPLCEYGLDEEGWGFSHRFRPGRGPHDALDALAVGIKQVGWVLDADIRDFFTTP
jgi:retron-type reverse transcriptase